MNKNTIKKDAAGFYSVILVTLFVMMSAVIWFHIASVKEASATTSNPNPTEKRFTIDYNKIETFEQSPLDRLWWNTKTGFNKTKDFTKGVWEKSKDHTSNAWNKTKTVTTNVWEKSKEHTNNAWVKTKTCTSGAWDKTKNFTVKSWEKVTKRFSK